MNEGEFSELAAQGDDSIRAARRRERGIGGQSSAHSERGGRGR